MVEKKTSDKNVKHIGILEQIYLIFIHMLVNIKVIQVCECSIWNVYTHSSRTLIINNRDCVIELITQLLAKMPVDEAVHDVTTH